MAKPEGTRKTRTGSREKIESRVNVLLTANERIKLETLATLNEMTLSDFVRQAIKKAEKCKC